MGSFTSVHAVRYPALGISLLEHLFNTTFSPRVSPVLPVTISEDAGLAQWHNWHLPWCTSSLCSPCRNGSCHRAGCTGPVGQQCACYLKRLPIFLFPLQQTYQQCTLPSRKPISTEGKETSHEKRGQETGLHYLYVIVFSSIAIYQETGWFEERG